MRKVFISKASSEFRISKVSQTIYQYISVINNFPTEILNNNPTNYFNVTFVVKYTTIKYQLFARLYSRQVIIVKAYHKYCLDRRDTQRATAL